MRRRVLRREPQSRRPQTPERPTGGRVLETRAGSRGTTSTQLTDRRSDQRFKLDQRPVVGRCWGSAVAELRDGRVRCDHAPIIVSFGRATHDDVEERRIRCQLAFVEPFAAGFQELRDELAPLRGSRASKRRSGRRGCFAQSARRAALRCTARAVSNRPSRYGTKPWKYSRISSGSSCLR